VRHPYLLGRRGLLAAALAATGLLVAGPAAGRAAARPAAPGHAGRWITDSRGRVLIVHGINMVYKLPPYYPEAVGFGDDDAAFLASIGFNAVRVGVIWKAVEPQPGIYDDAYLTHIANTVATLARHGILSVLDFHQDLFNERFQGEGAPDWAVQDGGLPNPSLGFPGNYLANPALEHALDAFWANAAGPGGVGLQDRYAAAWGHVAARFAGNPDVLGYEVLNEPFPGTAWEPCGGSGGCPAFDGKLAAFYRRVDRSVRAVDRRALIWHEPNVLFDQSHVTSLGSAGDPRSGFAFHDYCLSEPSTGSPSGCASGDDAVFASAVSHVSTTGEALMETEFGATNDTAYLDDMVQRGDRYKVPWLEWAYCGCSDPTTSGPGAKQAIVLDPARPPAGSNLVGPTLHSLVEPYPQVIAGTPEAWRYARSTGTLTMRYSRARAAAGGGTFPTGSLSEVATPAFAYPGGYSVRVSGAAIVSARNAGTLLLAACPRAASVSLTVAPSAHGGGSCRPRLRVSVSPRSARGGRTTRLRILVRAVLGRYRHPVAGATVRLTGAHVYTNRRGRATVRVTLRHRARAYRIRIRVSAPGLGRARASVRVRPN
jgi:endoglycosylceramidase